VSEALQTPLYDDKLELIGGILGPVGDRRDTIEALFEVDFMAIIQISFKDIAGYIPFLLIHIRFLDAYLPCIFLDSDRVLVL